MNVSQFFGLPDLPQCELLRTVAANLWEREDVVALWVGGSIGRGAGDAYSDVDLRMAVVSESLEIWREIDLNPLFAEQVVMAWLSSFEPETFVHHLLLQSGEVYDLHVQSVEKEPPLEQALVLVYRDLAFGDLLRERGKGEKTAVYDRPVNSDKLQQFLKMHWVNVHKAQKVIARDLHLVSWIGLNQILRPTLLRLTYILATGRDCGDLRRATIHSLTPIVRQIQGYAQGSVLQVVGAPLQSVEDILAANEALNTAVSQAGRDVATRFGFEYPAEVEAVVLRSWAKFRQKIG